MLTDHRRALWYALALLASLGFVLFAVGKHPPSLAPLTTLPFVGRFDQQMYDAVDRIRVTPLTWLFRFLNVVGGGVVTIPLRAIAAIYLLVRRWWRRAAGFILTWAASELLLTFLKAWFHRGRPPAGIVVTVGYSFPSGHATAGAATAVALVLAFLPAGRQRRKWEWIAVAFAFVMAFSRVYLHAHWFSDVVAGVLLGSGIASGVVRGGERDRDVGARQAGRSAGDGRRTPELGALIGHRTQPTLLRPPDEIGEPAERDLDAERQGPEQQHGRHDRRLVPSRRGQPADVAELDHAEASGRDRERRDQPAEREHGEHLGGAHLLLGDAQIAERQQAG